MSFDNYVVLKCYYPSYLQGIFRQQQEITLIHAKSKPFVDESFISTDPRFKSEPEGSSADLTGNPLILDLKDDEDWINASSQIQQLDNWTEEENEHYPMNLSEGRSMLNILNKEQVRCGGVENVLAPMMYCVLEPKKLNPLVLMGSNLFTNTRVMVYIKGCHSRSHGSMKISEMVAKHQKNCGHSSVINSEVSAVYSIAGRHIRKGTSLAGMTLGSILLETSWDNLVYDPVAAYIKDIKIKLQTMVGHPDSSLNIFWEQLNTIQSCIDMFSRDINLDKMEISSTPMEISEILDSLRNISCKNQNRKILMMQKFEFKDLNLDKLRDEDFLDQLWGLLINCKNVADIRECLIYIFVECAQCLSIRYKVPEDNTTSVGNILNGILEGTLAVPTISSSLALTYLIELGLQKLRNDYFYLMNYFDQLQRQHLQNQWNELLVDVMKVSKINHGAMVAIDTIAMASRMTRMTIAKGPTALNHVIVKQVDHLANLHVALQFLYLAKTNDLPEEMFSDLVKAVFSSYSFNNPLCFKTLQNDRLCEIDVASLCSVNTETLNVVSWNLKMVSNKGSSFVTTIFHHSENPIIPSCIYKDYNIPLEDNKEKMYYVIEAAVYTK